MSSPTKPQYQHYVPRFILRYFGTDVQPYRVFQSDGHSGYLSVVEPSSAIRKRSQPQRINIYYVKERKLVLASELGKRQYKESINRNYGIMDMYVDRNHPDPNHIEKKFSELESSAAKVVQLVVNAGRETVSRSKHLLTVNMERRQLNILRKFLFTMTYRNSHRASQFCEDNFDPPTQRDINIHVLQNMTNKQAKGREVWLQNIQEFLDTPVWEIPYNRKIFVHDRFEYGTELRKRRLIFWQISDHQNEFIMCDTGFGFFDGFGMPMSISAGMPAHMLGFLEPHMDPSNLDPSSRLSSAGDGGVFIWLRVFPVSPHLVLVLVNGSLANNDQPALEYFQRFGPPSRFHDFPFPKVMPTEYRGLSRKAQDALKRGDLNTLCGVPNMLEQRRQRIENGEIFPPTYIDGKVMESREDDVFHFPIAQLTTKQVQLVNGLFLENAKDSLTFRSPESLYRSIRAYEKEPLWCNGRDYKELKRSLRTILQEKRA
ncbi:hypothetical protein BV898_00272 [Hypsibius exemplaris]|uniref:DUF4238 domain-containing protein n=1 Tax=Hypsibius exemplaris TaxID=2072580 RepID=A0A1W0XF93_HYPEX|nr:hypothetical protein BV898_00272 [Hypsibius exemplaris]